MIVLNARKSQYRRLQFELPRPNLGNAKYELTIAKGLAEKHVMRIEDRDTRRFTAQKAGATLAQARANLRSTQTDLERLAVYAPVGGQVMQLNVHLGELASTGALQTPLILFGNVEAVYVRVDVDEKKLGGCGPTRQRLDISVATSMSAHRLNSFDSSGMSCLKRLLPATAPNALTGACCR
jgi:multidrug resistance efflux pump